MNRKRSQKKIKFSKLTLSSDKPCSPKQTISKYFSSVQTIQTPIENSDTTSSVNENKLFETETNFHLEKNLNETNDEKDFESPKSSNVLRSAFHELLKTSKRKIKKKKETVKVTNQINNSSDTNQDNLQLAIALSKSSYELENPGLTSDDDITFPYPSTQQKIANVKQTLEKFGFQTGKPNVNSFEEHSNHIQKRRGRQKFKRVTPILFIRTEEERQKIIENKIAKLFSNIKSSNENNSCGADDQSTERKPTSFLLRDLYDPKKTIFKINTLSLEEMDNLDIFYNNTVEKSNVKVGALLRDWHSIPGREKTPEYEPFCLTPEISNIGELECPDQSKSLSEHNLILDNKSTDNYLSSKTLNVDMDDMDTSNSNQNLNDEQAQDNSYTYDSTLSEKFYETMPRINQFENSQNEVFERSITPELFSDYSYNCSLKSPVLSPSRTDCELQLDLNPAVTSEHVDEATENTSFDNNSYDFVDLTQSTKSNDSMDLILESDLKSKLDETCQDANVSNNFSLNISRALDIINENSCVSTLNETQSNHMNITNILSLVNEEYGQASSEKITDYDPEKKNPSADYSAKTIDLTASSDNSNSIEEQEINEPTNNTYPNEYEIDFDLSNIVNKDSRQIETSDISFENDFNIDENDKISQKSNSFVETELFDTSGTKNCEKLQKTFISSDSEDELVPQKSFNDCQDENYAHNSISNLSKSKNQNFSSTCISSKSNSFVETKLFVASGIKNDEKLQKTFISSDSEDEPDLQKSFNDYQDENNVHNSISNLSKSKNQNISSTCISSDSDTERNLQMKNVESDLKICDTENNFGHKHLSCSQSSVDSTVEISDEELNYSSVISNKASFFDDNIENLIVKYQTDYICNNGHNFSSESEKSPEKDYDISNKFNKSNNQIHNLSDSFNKALKDDELWKKLNASNKQILETVPGNSIIRKTPVKVVTPDLSNKEFIIKTHNVTPIANYDEMDTPRRNKELDKFGLKPLKRAQGVKMLKYIYNATHPMSNILEKKNKSSSDDEDNRVVKRRKTITMRTKRNVLTCDRTTAKFKNDFLKPARNKFSNNIPIEDMIFERKQSTKIHSCRIPLHVVWNNFLDYNPEIKEKMLLYEPLQVENIYLSMKKMGFKFHIEDLIIFFDKKCITIRTNQNNTRNNKRNSPRFS